MLHGWNWFGFGAGLPEQDRALPMQGIRRIRPVQTQKMLHPKFYQGRPTST